MWVNVLCHASHITSALFYLDAATLVRVLDAMCWQLLRCVNTHLIPLVVLRFVMISFRGLDSPTIGTEMCGDRHDSLSALAYPDHVRIWPLGLCMDFEVYKRAPRWNHSQNTFDTSSPLTKPYYINLCHVRFQGSRICRPRRRYQRCFHHRHPDRYWILPLLVRVAAACGIVSQDTDLVTSVATSVFDKSLCNKEINASYNGKNVTVKVTDSCNPCSAADLDFSPSAFENIAPLSDGKIKAMHPALDIVELLRHIFGYLNEDFDITSGCVNGRTLSALARTCQTFKEPALDALWENLSSLDPLIKCLPEGSQKLVELPRLYQWVLAEAPRFRLAFSQPLTGADWLIIRNYANRVRGFYMTSLDLDYLDVLLELSLGPSEMLPLFPNTRHLEWTVTHTHFRPYMRMFLPSTLESLRFAISSNSGRGDASILAAIGSLCPSLKKVDVDFSKNVEGGLEAFSRSVCNWKHLVSLRCMDITDAALAHVAGLSALRDLSVTLPPVTSFRAIRSQIEGNAFENLRALEMRAESLDVFVALASEMTLSLVDTKLMIVDNGCSESAKDAFMVLSNSSRPLYSLKIHGWGDDTFIPMPLNSSQHIRGRTVTISTFRPLFKFGELRILDVDFKCSTVFTNSDIIDLARSFPLLEKLSLNVEHGWEVPSAITYSGIFSVASICPHLQDLGVEFDATGTDQAELLLDTFPEDEQTQVSPNANIKFLGVANSRIEDVIATVKLLLRFFPNIEHIHQWYPPFTVGSGFPDWLSPDYSEFMRRWGKAGAVITRLRARNPASADGDVEIEDLMPTDTEVNVYDDDDEESVDFEGDDDGAELMDDFEEGVSDEDAFGEVIYDDDEVKVPEDEEEQLDDEGVDEEADIEDEPESDDPGDSEED
ncbi:hypothetical protein CONPUDRAFT_143481 [Coniophora puteana RWD-64-598 SS2]|uniref:RlpA-like protein double-psi beta-barrel domain-containing protein n=1 Tax=Coniophora puteana (strain RWD-64-598) TaxID=741705 RepID=A0A5M3MRM1_CONPW|nr:uncharacterized protein CONPUDRAFT_143481 [Coniophora puteana RWD-64-598 SS2]EIW81799.1 hypothetical protein CONPUDRAFT_143481 [Coniophora puteana RWD-64-598 SS2]